MADWRELRVDGGRLVEGGRGGGAAGLGEEWAGFEVLPGFIDAHCHVLPMGLDLLKLNLSAHGSREEVLDAVRDGVAGMGEEEGWLLATHYDQTKFPGARHLDRWELDSVSGDRPVLLRHSNGHASVANSAALLLAGVGEDVVDPVGGEYVRDESGRVTGVLLEKAHEFVTSRAPEPDLEQMVSAILRAGESMSRFGITCATDMMTGRWDLERELTAYRLASERGCAVRLRLSAQFAEMFAAEADPARAERVRGELAAMDGERCRMIGLKVFADGAIGSATAAVYEPYLTTGGRGQLIYPEERLAEIIAEIDARGWACAVHTIGDWSTDLVMDAYENTEDPRRHRIEHAMILSDTQIERLGRLGSHVTMQPEFLMRFGHAYRAQLGAGVWPRLKRLRSVLAAGVPMSLNSDRPIVPGNPWDGVRSAVERPEGFDAAEAVDGGTAFSLYTHGGAVANGDGDWLGRLEAGFAADYQVYEGLPGIGGPGQGSQLVAVAVGGEVRRWD